MHSIERYGIVALLFLVVTVVAVLMWDGGKKKKPEEVVGKAPAPVVDAGEPRAIDPENRLSLISPSKPGPLVRDLSGVAAPGTTPAPAGDELQPSLEPRGPATTPTEPAGQAYLPEPEPAPSQRPVAEVPPSGARDYVVKSGDTLSEIAQRELGSSRRWQEIVALNPGLDPARLRSGKTIRLPGDARVAGGGSAPKSAPAPKAEGPKKETVAASGRTHKVGKGENLWKIAERTLGDGKRWKEIAALNPSVNPDKLVLGQVLKLPAGSTGAAPSAGTRVAAKKPQAKEPLVASVDERPARRGGKVK